MGTDLRLLFWLFITALFRRFSMYGFKNFVVLKLSSKPISVMSLSLSWIPPNLSPDDLQKLLFRIYDICDNTLVYLLLGCSWKQCRIYIRSMLSAHANPILSGNQVIALDVVLSVTGLARDPSSCSVSGLQDDHRLAVVDLPYLW